MIDLRNAINVLSMMSGDNKIGIIKTPIYGMVSSLTFGTVVIFRKEKNHGSTITVEIPMTKEEIAVQIKKCSLNVTKNCMVGVFSDNVEEIIIK